MEVKNHGDVDSDAIAELDIHQGAKHDVHQHGGFQQRKQSPLVIVVGLESGGPGAEEILEQPHHFLPERVFQINGSITAPPAVRSVRGSECSKLRHDPRDHQGDGGGEDETRRTAEGTLRDGGEGAELVSIAGLLDGLQSTDISGQESEDGDTQATLPGNSENGPLENPRGCVAIVAGGK